MIYLKSVLVGIVAALAASVIWIAAVFVLPIAAPILMSRLLGTYGSAGAGASVSSGSVMIAGLVGFIGGFYWHSRRVTKSRPRS